MASRNGAFIPTYMREDPETGEMAFALDADDLRQIIAGYGCASCLADYRGVWAACCPVCGRSADANRDIVDQWWTNHGWKKGDPI